MSAYGGASKFFQISLDELARAHQYSEENILILQGKFSELEKRYPDTYRNILSCAHHSDERKPEDYAQDLVASWLIEDEVLSWLNQDPNLIARLSGTDCERKILSSPNISSKSDFIIEFITEDFNETSKLELMNDYTGYCITNRVADLRDAKYDRLESEKAFLLILISPPNSSQLQFALIDFRTPPKYVHIDENSKMGNKSVKQIAVPAEIIKDARPSIIANEIKSLLLI